MTSDGSEPLTFNQAKVLFEAQDHKLSIIANGVAGLHVKVDRLEARVDNLERDVALMMPMVRSLDTRVAALEAKP